MAFYGNYAEFAQAQANVENAIIAFKDDLVVMVIASNECTADLNSAVDSALGEQINWGCCRLSPSMPALPPLQWRHPAFFSLISMLKGG